jgi:hypothetical protein
MGVALALGVPQASAHPVHVTLEWPAGVPASTSGPVHIQAIQMAGHTNPVAPIEAEAKPNGVLLDLKEGVWQIHASVSGYWSPATEVAVPSPAPASVRLTLWPAGSLRGEILTSGGEALPDAVEVRLSATPAPAAGVAVHQARGLIHAELRCHIDRGTWSCVAPSGIFDVRLEVAGYAPRYEWAVKLKPEDSTYLGQTVLRREASVFGRAVRKDGSDPPGPCRAILQPDMTRHGGPPDPESAPPDEKRFSVPLSPRGYFQIVGLQPGRHLLSVNCPAASGFRELRIQPQAETRIDPPLPLEELTFDVSVIPNADPIGQPWRLTIDETAPLFRRIAHRVAISTDGRWTRHGLTAGNYHAVISSADGTSWMDRYFNLGAGSGPLLLRLGSLKVGGRVRLNMQPVRAQLRFFNDAGGKTATLTSDEDGRFQGLLPVSANGKGTSWTVEAHVAQPPVTRRLLNVQVPVAGGAGLTWLDLDFPTVAVRGSVVSQDGQPQAGAQVTFEDSSGARTTTATDDAGNFQISELQPGKYTATAGSPEGVSERMPLEVSEGRESELKLVLTPSERATFYVVSSQGPVADAAVQVWIRPGVPREFVHTDPDGRFEVKVPPGTTEVGLTVGAPGYALKLLRLPISNDDDAPPDTRTITLDQSGGKLVLNFHASGRTLDAFSPLYLVHNGAIQDARTLVGWGTDQTGTTGDGPAVVEAIEPGNYALCRVDPAQVGILWSGPLPTDRCRTGSLEEGDTLTLAP